MEIDVDKMIQKQKEINARILKQEAEREVVVEVNNAEFYKDKVSHTNVFISGDSIVLTRMFGVGVKTVFLPIGISAVKLIPWLEVTDEVFYKCYRHKG